MEPQRRPLARAAMRLRLQGSKVRGFLAFPILSSFSLSSEQLACWLSLSGLHPPKLKTHLVKALSSSQLLQATCFCQTIKRIWDTFHLENGFSCVLHLKSKLLFADDFRFVFLFHRDKLTHHNGGLCLWNFYLEICINPNSVNLLIDHIQSPP